MPTLLQLDSSPSETSISRELTAEFVHAWMAAHNDGVVIARDLAAFPPPPIDALWIEAAFTPEPALTTAQKAKLAVSEELISELQQAGEFVFGVAMHNFHVPAVLKLWIDQVVRAGRTFTYGASGPQGLLTGKKATIIIASGGNYEEGTPGASLNFIEPYLRTLLGFLGVADVRFVIAGGAARIRQGSLDRETFLMPARTLVRAVAA